MSIAASAANSHAIRVRFTGLLRKSFSAHAIYFAIATAYYAAFLLLLFLRPDLEPSGFLKTAIPFVMVSLPFMLLCLAIMRFCHMVRFVKPAHPIPYLLRDLRNFLGSARRMAHGLPMVLVMLLFMYVFMAVKESIPFIAPFSWDQGLSEIDKAMHFGAQPWQILQPFFGYWPLTFLINVNYNMWFVVMWSMWVFFAFSDHTSELRTHFFLTFFLTWVIGGSFLATLFSSAGPCYFTRLGISPDPYAELMTYLRQANTVVPVWAVDIQDTLWRGYHGESTIKGISAMPSMHNGSALLFVLAAFRISRPLGWILSAHCAFIFIGSVHLGWHYAVDAYAAWVFTVLVWWMMKPVAAWWHKRPEQTEFNAAFASSGAD
jgi:hypothetical protein